MDARKRDAVTQSFGTLWRGRLITGLNAPEVHSIRSGLLKHEKTNDGSQLRNT